MRRHLFLVLVVFLAACAISALRPGPCSYARFEDGSSGWIRRPALRLSGWEACIPEPADWTCADMDPTQGEPGCQ